MNKVFLLFNCNFLWLFLLFFYFRSFYIISFHYKLNFSIHIISGSSESTIIFGHLIELILYLNNIIYISYFRSYFRVNFSYTFITKFFSS